MSREKSREKNLVTRPASVFTLLVLLCASLLSGCGQSRPTDFYMLASDHVPLNAASLPTRTMAIGALIVPGYLDRPGVVVRAADGTGLTVPRFNVWAEPLQQGMRRVLSSMLAEPMLRENVTMLPMGADRPDTTYALHIEVLRMDADTKGNVVLEARWALLDRENRTMLSRGSFASSETVNLPPFGTSQMFDAIVAAESRLVQGFARDLAKVLPKTLERRVHKPDRPDRTAR